MHVSDGVLAHIHLTVNLLYYSVSRIMLFDHFCSYLWLFIIPLFTHFTNGQIAPPVHSGPVLLYVQHVAALARRHCRWEAPEKRRYKYEL